jgi:hypothetical protein
MAAIQAGARVHARSAFGEDLERRAFSGVMQGKDIPVVWVTKEEEWQAAQAEGRVPDGVPWPARDVRLAAD